MLWFLTEVLPPALFGLAVLVIVLFLDEVISFLGVMYALLTQNFIQKLKSLRESAKTSLTTLVCTRCEERKPSSECFDYWGKYLCRPCLVEHKREGKEDEERRLLDLEVQAERRRVLARKIVQDEELKKGYRD